MSDTINCPKCKAEHEPTGSHDDDSGERECESCGFAFHVEIEYDPYYNTYCVEHVYGPEQVIDGHRCRSCTLCYSLQVLGEASE